MSKKIEEQPEKIKALKESLAGFIGWEFADFFNNELRETLTEEKMQELQDDISEFIKIAKKQILSIGEP